MAAISQRYIGCVGPTAQPDIFVFSVAEGRDFTTGEPPGTPIPQKSELPEGAPPPIPPVTVTTGSPGGGPTPTTRITTYSLIADGGTNLRSYVGHTVEILGRPEERPSRNSTAASTEPSRMLYITSIRDLADHCR